MRGERTLSPDILLSGHMSRAELVISSLVSNEADLKREAGVAELEKYSKRKGQVSRFTQKSWKNFLGLRKNSIENRKVNYISPT